MKSMSLGPEEGVQSLGAQQECRGSHCQRRSQAGVLGGAEARPAPGWGRRFTLEGRKESRRNLEEGLPTDPEQQEGLLRGPMWALCHMLHVSSASGSVRRSCCRSRLVDGEMEGRREVTWPKSQLADCRARCLPGCSDS